MQQRYFSFKTFANLMSVIIALITVIMRNTSASTDDRIILFKYTIFKLACSAEVIAYFSRLERTEIFSHRKACESRTAKLK